MNLTVNGKGAIVEGKDSLDVNALLVELKVEQPDYVTVELNGDILERENFAQTLVKDGDTVEFLYFMGGGSR
ncbi:sulfur carrier protein ThiS [Geotalea sp. SG265]|uniref:sulfur carrier protein ThiS n=1 Tax=Geotalea sp. SG265 TaxID=2922867 RepID=UPI001FAF586C|nr:sulfur carrier protein ThiS [Geotalea sp. SG265]